MKPDPKSLDASRLGFKHKGKSLDVSRLGFKHKGKLVRTILICSTIFAKSRTEWTQGPIMVFINGKRVPLNEGQPVVEKIYKKIDDKARTGKK